MPGRDTVLGIAERMHYDIVKLGGGFRHQGDAGKPSGWSASGNRCLRMARWACGWRSQDERPVPEPRTNNHCNEVCP